MDHRQLVRTLSAGRVVVGAALVVLPGAAAARWIGPIADDPGAKVAIRAMGGRDLAIGLGTMQALARGEAARGWTLAGAASDLADAAASIVAIRHLGARRALPVVAAASVAAVASYVAAGHLDGPA